MEKEKISEIITYIKDYRNEHINTLKYFDDLLIDEDFDEDYDGETPFRDFYLMAVKAVDVFDLTDCLEKLGEVICLRTELSNLVRKKFYDSNGNLLRKIDYNSLLLSINDEIEKLEALHRLGLLPFDTTKKGKVKRFETVLSSDDRLSLCDEIMLDTASDKPNYNKIFIGEVDKPTLMYLLGSDRPEKIKKIRITTHKKVYDLLLSISNHTYNGNICVPNFVKNIICPEILCNRYGETIKKLNERVP